MDNASKDVLFTIALDLDLPNLLNWCQASSKIHQDVCNNDNVWRIRLLKDYPNYQDFKLDKSLKETYVFMYQLSYIKKMLDSDESLLDIFLKEKIHLSHKKIEKVPAFDLPNLKFLSLSWNQIKKVPKFNLPNLEVLFLNRNDLSEVPEFNLPNLQILDLRGNRLTKIPAFDLPKLISLDLSENKLTKVPEFRFPNLKSVLLYHNPLEREEKRKLKQKWGKKVEF